MTFSGVNQGQAYSGTGSWARQETGDESENASLTELGCYANGSFNLSDIVCAASGARSTSSGDTVQSTWSGEYYGTATYTGSDASDSSVTKDLNRLGYSTEADDVGVHCPDAGIGLTAPNGIVESVVFGKEYNDQNGLFD